MVSVPRLAFLSVFRPPILRNRLSIISSNIIRSSNCPLAAATVLATTATLFARPTQPQPLTERMRPLHSTPSSSGASSSGKDDLVTGYLGAEEAAALDAELMTSPGFSLEQLMELAGLAVAEAVFASFPPRPMPGKSKGRFSKTRVLLICGPGNNGGDGLVAARHLVHFGYECAVVYPKKSKKEHFVNLVKQCYDMKISILDDMPVGWSEKYDVVVDSIFGFSFHGTPREPFKSMLEEIIQQKNVPVVSVDVPSGWNVDEGDVSGMGFMPDVLVSLTTPKHSAKSFTGRHFVGGRFLPPGLAEKYGVKMPPYPGVSQVMEMPRMGKLGGSEDGDWALQYARHSAEREASDADRRKSGVSEMDRASMATVSCTSETPEDWALEYDRYLHEKHEFERKLAKDQDLPGVSDSEGNK